MRELRKELLVLSVISSLAGPGGAQLSNIVLDGSLPNGLTDDLTPPGSGPAYTIDSTLGEARGANLFHSFSDFSIGAGESATFSDSTATAFQNVIARVTGGDPSAIDGTLRSTIATADFYLLNPSGVLFGGSSAIELPRSLYVSSAHTLGFADQQELDLVDPGAPILSPAAPERFGFLGDESAGEIVFANPFGPGAAKTLRLNTGQTFSAVGGDVSVLNRTLLLAPEGRVQLVAVGSAAAEVPLDAAGFGARSGDPAALGEVRVSGQSQLVTVSARTQPQGSVVIRGGRFTLESGSVVRAGGVTGGGGTSIDVEVAGAARLAGALTILRSEAPGDLPSGGARIAADAITVEDGALAQTLGAGAAAAGSLHLEARSIRIEDGGVASTLARGSGRGGDVVLDAAEIDVARGQIQSLATSSGRGGDLRIGERAGGEVADRIGVIDGTVASEGSTLARGGDVALTADEIELRGGLTQVSSLHLLATAPQEGVPPIAGGTIRIDARGADSLLVAEGALVSSENRSPQPGGPIEIRAGSFEISGGSASRSSTVQTTTTAAGAAGDVSIEANEVRIGPAEGSERAGLLASFVAPGATGPGGDLTLEVGSLVVEGGGQMSTTTLGSGASGAITITAEQDVSLRGDRLVAGAPVPSGLFSRSETNADGGAVDVAARSIKVLDGAEISTVASTTGDSGGVTLRAEQDIRVAGTGQQGSVVTARGVDGDGGDVALEADLVEVLAGGSVDVSTSGAGDGGLLRVSARELVVSGVGSNGLPSSLAAESGGAGDAGGIELDVEVLRVEEGGEITAISQGFGGSGGDIAILGAESVTVETGGVVTALSQNLQIADGEMPGSLRIEDAGSVTVASGGRLDARSVGSGDGGNVAMSAESLLVDAARITAEAANGTGGDVSLRASQMRLASGAEVAVRSTGGDAGVVAIEAGTFEMSNALITAQAKAFGGNVDIKATQLVYLLNSEVNALSEGGTLDGPAGGNITIDPPAVVLNASRLVADGRGNANGGNIFVAADPFLASTDSLLSASSEFGLEGTVVVDAPESELSSELAALPSDLQDPSSLLREACLARDAPSGSFTVRGESRLRAPPDAPLPSDLGACAGAADCRAP